MEQLINKLKGFKAADDSAKEMEETIKQAIELLEKQDNELNEQFKEIQELRELRNKLSICTAIALDGRKISISKKTLAELNNMFIIEMEYRPSYDDYVFYAK